MTVLAPYSARTFFDSCRLLVRKRSSVDRRSHSGRRVDRTMHPFSAVEQQRRMEEAEIDRWSTTTQFRWRKCFSCACFMPNDDVICDVCGVTTSSFSATETKLLIAGTPEMSTLRQVRQDDTARVEHILHTKMLPAENDNASHMVENILHAKMQPVESDACEDDKCTSEGCEYVDVAGVLDESPPPGTLVEVLFSDDWQSAVVVKASGSSADIIYDDGVQETIDIQESAVRLRRRSLPAICELEGSHEIREMQLVEELEEDESEHEFTLGTLDSPPPAGTVIEVLHEDDVWRRACIIEAHGSKASVLYEDDNQDQVDFSCEVIRLYDYSINAVEDGDDEGVSTTGLYSDIGHTDHEKYHSEHDSDLEDEYDEIPGALESSPPVGTQVKILHESDSGDVRAWCPAQIIEAIGLKAKVLYDCGGLEDIVFANDIVRLHDYFSDDEGDCDDDEDILTIGLSGEAESTNHEKHSGEHNVVEVGDEGSENQFVEISEVVYEPPPAGTQVKALHEDDSCRLAQMIETNGKKPYDDAEVEFDRGLVVLV